VTVDGVPFITNSLSRIMSSPFYALGDFLQEASVTCQIVDTVDRFLEQVEQISCVSILDEILSALG